LTDFASDPEKNIPQPPRRSATRNILTVMGGTLASRVLGLLRQTLFNRFFDTAITDAFNVAFRVPNLFRELLAEGGLSNSIIPVYKSLAPGDRKAFASSFLGLLIGVNAVIVGLGFIFAPQIVDLLIENGSRIDVNLAVLITRLVMPFLAGISFSALAMGLLNAEEKFAATSFAPLAFNVSTILGFVLFPNNAIMLGAFTTLGGFAQLIVQIPSLRRYGLLPTPRLARHPALGRALSLMAPFAFTTSVRQFLNVILARLLTRFGDGAVTGFYNAEVIFQLALGLFAVSPATAAYPRMATFAANRDWDSFRDTLSSYARLVLFFSAVVSALMFALAPSVVSAVIELAGRVSNDKFSFTMLAVPPFALAIAPWGLNQLLVRAFYVREKTRDAVLVNAAAFLLNTGLYLAFAPWGFAAMNYATTVTGWVMVGVYVAVLHAQVGLDWKKLLGHALKVGLAALVAGLVASLVTAALPYSRGALNAFLHLSVAGGLGLIVYLGLCAVLRVPELETIRKRILRR
jgi:putative peptidoglycan lipid II flippase